MASYGIKENTIALYNKLNDIESSTIIHCNTVHGLTNIFAWPVYTAGKSTDEGRATVGFFVSPETLKKRIISVTGEIGGYVYLFYRNMLISNFNSSSITPKSRPSPNVS